MTAVKDGEILTEVRLPLERGGGSAHEKVERRAGDFAIAAASAAVWVDGGKIADAGIALSAVGPTTIHVTRAEELLRGSLAVGGAVRAGGRRSPAEDCSPIARRPRTGRLQAPPRGRADQARAAPSERPRAEAGGLIDAI